MIRHENNIHNLWWTAMAGILSGALAAAAEKPATIGRRIFLDTGLSNPPGQGCVSCHSPAAAFADPRPVSPGAVAGRAGTRNAPSLMYAALIPSFAFDESLTPDGGEVFAWEGGLFLDGRARDLFEQVGQPFFHADEMNLADATALAAGLRKTDYADVFHQWVGDASWADDAKLVYHAKRALVDFLKEPMFRPFNARIDDYLAGNESALSAAEKRGLDVFRGAGKCVACHFLEPMNWPHPLLSDFGYDNVGAPSRGPKDPGLGARTKDPGDLGSFRAPSLRNVALTAPYLHNGSIATLREVLEFYNQRDLEPERWGPTDYPATVNHRDMGDLGLSVSQIDDLLALMNAFTDRHLLHRQPGDHSLPEAPPGVPSTKNCRYHFPDWTHQLDPLYPGDG